jgi:predicted TIM-barrel fold metal-dependent hydrolase
MGINFLDEAVRAGNLEGAINDTLTLAKYPNVSVKLSGLFSKEPYPYRDSNPLIERLFDNFGP